MTGREAALHFKGRPGFDSLPQHRLDQYEESSLTESCTRLVLRRITEIHSSHSHCDSNGTGLKRWVQTEASRCPGSRDSGLSTHHACPSEETGLDLGPVAETVPGEELAEGRTVKGRSEPE